MKLDRHIFLTGFMGCGKSTCADCLCRMTGAGRMEMDQEIVSRQKMEIAEIFKIRGEPFFRELETELLRELKGREPMVVSCGGGAVLREENVALMRAAGEIVFLTAEPETVFSRVKDSTERPVLNGNMNLPYIRELMEKRRPQYEGAADFMVPTDGRTAEEICREILRKCQEREETFMGKEGNPVPQGKYVPASRFGNLIFTAGMTPRNNGVLIREGKILCSEEISGYRDAVRQAAKNALTAAKNRLEEGETIAGILSITVYVNAEEGFMKQSRIADLASEYFCEELGENGVGSRAAVGVASLPGNAPVEISIVVGVGK